MDIISALFTENINLRQVPGPSTRIDLSGIMFSLAAPSEPPVTIGPHLVVIVRCRENEPGDGILEVGFKDEKGEDAAAAVRDVLRPGTLLGCAAGTVVGGDREVEDEPAVSLWAGDTGPVAPFHLTSIGTPDGDALVGWPAELPLGASALLLLADP